MTLTSSPLRRRLSISLSILFAALTASRSWASPSFPNQLFATGQSPRSVALGDFNADGYLDLATANRWSDDVSVLLGQGDGTFSPESRYQAGGQPVSIVIGDFNLDGIVDLVTKNSYSGNFSFLKGEGDGTFLPELLSNSTSSEGAMASGDFNEDGVLDLAVPSGSGVFLQAGLGNGRFASPFPILEYDPYSRFGSLAISDLNADGHLDIAAPNGSGVVIFLGHGNWDFDPPRFSDPENAATSVTAGDVTGDGIPDLEVSSVYYGGIAILKGHGDGTFIRMPMLENGPGSGDVSIGDFNGDGYADLAATSTGENPEVSVFLGFGDGRFQARSRFQGGGSPDGIAVGDLDRDGDQELVVGSDGLSVCVLLGQGDGTFGPQIGLEAGYAPLGVALGDFNNDGNNDMVVANRDSQDISIRLGIGNGNFGEDHRVPAGAGPLAVGVADFNHDGKQDIAVAGFDAFTFADDLMIFLGRGDGTFYFFSQSKVGTSPLSLSIGDLNNDGNLDLLTANVFTSDISILLGLGDGTFSHADTVFSEVPPRSIALVDLDGDSYLDLAVPGFTGIWVHFGDGDGYFGRRIAVPTQDQPAYVAAGDFDRDGRPDIAVSSLFLGHVSILLASEDGSFSQEVQYPVPGSPIDLTVSDIDGDGSQDLVAPNFLGGNVTILPGNPDGTFAKALQFAVDGGFGESISDIAVGDLNNDERLDLVATNNEVNFDRIWVLLNLPQNHPPVASAGADMTLECSSVSGAAVLLDGSDSTDPDSSTGTNDDITSFEWFIDFGTPFQTLLGTGMMLQTTLPLGTSHITLRVKDGQMKQSTDEVAVTVADTSPPRLALKLYPTFLWPPNHRLVDVRAEVIAEDACSTPTIFAESALSSESDDDPGAGDGNTQHDIEGFVPGSLSTSFRLRAERSGNGNGRKYTISYSATDSSANLAIATATVEVPQDQGKGIEPLEMRSLDSDESATFGWDTVPGAEFYTVIRGDLSSLREMNDRIDLGTLVCIMNNSSSTDTSGHPERTIPILNHGFFFLVSSSDGQDSSSFGSASASKPRAGNGGCP